MSNKPRFLVVDDEREVCNFFSYLLKNKGYEVETATAAGSANMEVSSAGKPAVACSRTVNLSVRTRVS